MLYGVTQSPCRLEMDAQIGIIRFSRRKRYFIASATGLLAKEISKEVNKNFLNWY